MSNVRKLRKEDNQVEGSCSLSQFTFTRNELSELRLALGTRIDFIHGLLDDWESGESRNDLLRSLATVSDLYDRLCPCEEVHG